MEDQKEGIPYNGNTFLVRFSGYIQPIYHYVHS